MRARSLIAAAMLSASDDFVDEVRPGAERLELALGADQPLADEPAAGAARECQGAACRVLVLAVFAFAFLSAPGVSARVSCGTASCPVRPWR